MKTRAYGDAAAESGFELGGQAAFQAAGSEIGKMLRERRLRAQESEDDQAQMRPQCQRGFEFKPFTRDSLRKISRRRERRKRQANNQNNNNNFDIKNSDLTSGNSAQIRLNQTGTPSNLSNIVNGKAIAGQVPIIEAEPDPYLASGQQLPPVLARQFPPELVGKPIEDIDPFYADCDTFVIISRGRELTRFSASKALCLFGPFHPIRRIVLCILVHPIFNLLVMLTIVTNCILMTLKGSDQEEKTEYIFTIVYTTEMGLKVLARGFIMEKFTYLRDPWNWLDFAVIIMAYLTIVVEDLGNLSVMRTFRVLRALKTVAIIPGMKTIVGAVIDSVKNLKDVVVLTLFSLSVFSLSGLQIYMGQLTQKCILDGPNNMTNREWFNWASNSSHWVPELNSEIYNSYRLCGNATGAQSCPLNHTCLQGFGPNPDYGFTNFDTFGWSLICSFRLMTQDYWEGLYMQLLKTAGSWHIIYFIISIFLGSIYLMNLILAIVAMSYNELQRRAEEEEEAAAEEEAAFLESCRQMELDDQLIGQYEYDMNIDDRKSSIMTETNRQQQATNNAFRPSIEIDLVDHQSSLRAANINSINQYNSNEFKQKQQISVYNNNYDSKKFLKPDHDSLDENANRLMMINNNQDLSLRSHSLTGDESRIKHEMNRNRQQLANPGDINRAQAVHPNLVVSMTELHHNHNHNHNQRQYDNIENNQGENFNYNEVNSNSQQFESVTTTNKFKQKQKRFALSRLRGNVKSSDNDSESKLLDLKRRAASIRIDFQDKTELCSNINMQHDNVSRSQILHGNNKQSMKLELSQMGLPKFSSDSVICEQPKSINANLDLPNQNNNDNKQQSHNQLLFRWKQQQQQKQQRQRSESCQKFDSGQLIVSGCNSPSSQQSLASQNSNESRLIVPNTTIIAATQCNPSSIKHFMTSSAAAANSTETINNQQQQKLQHQYQLGADLVNQAGQSRSPHHLSVENFHKFGATNPSLSNDNLPFNIRSNSNGPSPTGSMSKRQSIDNRLMLSASNRGNIHPNVMARSSFAWPRASLMPDSIQASHLARLTVAAAAANNNNNNNNNKSSSSNNGNENQQAGNGHDCNSHSQGGSPSVRRMSQHEYMRRASNWSRLSMSGNTDMRRLLRLWAHTNPYQITRVQQQQQQQQQTNGNNQGRCSPANSIVSQNLNLHLQYHYQQRLRQNSVYTPAGYNNGGSPRPSSVGSVRQAYELISAMSRRRSRYGFDQRYGLMEDPTTNHMLANGNFDQVSVTFRDKCLATCLSWLDALCIWECCDLWLQMQKLISLIVFDPFTELFIILCILINTLFMALDNEDAGEEVKSFLDRGNYFFTATFAVEASMKIMALSPKFYFREGWNVFDAIIVGLSLLELGLEGVYGLSVLRSFRLLRVFKLAKSWPTLNLLISIMGKAIGDLGNLTFVLAIIVFIFAVMGMQLFGNKYVGDNFPDGELPRWNFTDFMHSFMIVFRILCAEWIEPMWDCLLVGGWPCIPFFLIAVTVGNLVVLNLFLALLLASFGASNLSSPQSDNVDTKKLNEAIARFRRFGIWFKTNVRRFLRHLICNARKSLGCKPKKSKSNNSSALNSSDRDNSRASGGISANLSGKSAIVAMSRLERKKNIEIKTELLRNKIRNNSSNNNNNNNGPMQCPESPETRKHRNLSQLAQSQAKKCSNQQQNISHNFNYDYYNSQINKAQHQTESAKAHRHQNSNTNAYDSIKNLHNPTQNTIPIIIDEPCEFEETSPTVDLNTSIGQQPVANNGSIEPCISPVAEEICTSSISNVNESFTQNFVENLNYEQSVTNSFRLQDQESKNGRDILLPIREADSSANSEAESISLNLISTDKDDDYEDNDDSGEREQIEDRKNRHRLADLMTKDQRAITQTNSIQFNLKPTVLASDKKNFNGTDIDLKNQEKNLHNNNSKPIPLTAINQDQQIALQVEPPQSMSGAKIVHDMEEEDERTLLYVESYIERCICLGIICLKFFIFRRFVRKIVDHKYFDQAILALIIISSGTLALEDKHLNDRPLLKRTLDALDTIFTIVFSLEMLLKWLAFGIRRYFSNLWSWLDFLIVLVSFINLMASIFGSGKIQALKTMRTLRAMRGLRPLRALQRFQGMRVVVNALIQAIPSIFNVLLVCLIFWLIFSIMGVQMFGGKFWRCLDPVTGELVSDKIADNKQQCIERNLNWSNPQINFDNVLNAYLALFQVAIFKGWIEIMNSATDSRGRDDQPIREANIYMYFYFVFFVIFGSFFTLNLFIGVIIDNFNEQKKKTGGSLEIFMTDDQKKYYHAMKKMKSKRPIKAMTRPKFKLQALLFDITTSRRFDMTIMIIIGINMFVMALEHYGQSQEFSIILENLNLLFIAIFTLECLCKIFAMRHFYFREPWNIFDFIVVCLSILGVVMKEYVAKYFVSPTLLRVVRVVKVGRVLRLVKGAKGIRTLLFALAMSLPALFNICLLLFLVMFIYAIFGMSFFMNVRKRAGLDETFNFETFSSSIIVLFEMSTSAGWDLVLDPLMDEENDCQKPDPARGIEGTCGNKTIAIIYLMSYVIVTFLIIINMYIAVILENYSQATEDVQEGLTDDDYEMYYEIWQKFDPNGTQYLKLEELSDFLDALEDPLRIAKPNDLAIVILDINIYEGNRCYCVDILDALTKNFFARKGLNIQVNEHLEKVQSSIMHETEFQKITTTYWMKRESYCARMIQNSWRKWRQAVAEREQKSG